MGKVLDKQKLDKLIGMIREYWHDRNLDLADSRLRAMRMAINEDFGGTNIDILEFLHSILSCYGLKHEATNEDIYKALNALGWEVKTCETES